MSISKDHERGTYYVQCYYRDWTGVRKKKTKRGFKTKKAAAAWEVDFLRQMEGAPDMTLNAFYELYKKDIAKKVRITTQRGKQQLIETKILPYLGEKKLTDITPLDILSWQNAIQSGTTSNGLAYKDSYLRTIDNQLSAMLNHAVRYYNLPSNPMSKVDRMGSKKTDEMRFWTKDEYKRFSRAIMDKDVSFMIFEVLYWLGVRSGEALALTPADFDLKRGRVSITKTYHRIDGEDVTTPPKTRKSNRAIVLPRFLIDEVKDYLLAHPAIRPTDRMFPVTKNFLRHEMERGCRAAGLEPIRIHDLRHSHVSLLIEMGFSALAIADRLGHESTEVTMMYAHLFPNKQDEMAQQLDEQRGPQGAFAADEIKPMKEMFK